MARYMKFVKYYIECPRKDNRARGLVCIEIMVNKSGGKDATQKLDFELDIARHSQVATLRAYATTGSNDDRLPVVSIIKTPLDEFDPIKEPSLNQESDQDIDDLPAYRIKISKLKAPR